MPSLRTRRYDSAITHTRPLTAQHTQADTKKGSERNQLHHRSSAPSLGIKTDRGTRRVDVRHDLRVGLERPAQVCAQRCGRVCAGCVVAELPTPLGVGGVRLVKGCSDAQALLGLIASGAKEPAAEGGKHMKMEN